MTTIAKAAGREPAAKAGHQHGSAFVQPYGTNSESPGQTEHVEPPALAIQALKKAGRALRKAEACRAAGDRDGFLHWRRLMLQHQAVWWSAIHPPDPILEINA